MRSIDELTNGDSFWPTINRWLEEATSTVEVLPRSLPDGERELFALQVSTRSSLGAVVLETGGILIDHRWLRIIATGIKGLSPSIGRWNGLLDGAAQPLVPGGTVIAWDVLGGIFIMNGAKLPFEAGNICYFAPDSLDWTDLQMGYSEFLRWSLSDNMPRFYHHLRWPNWASEVSQLAPECGLSVYPPPFTKEGKRVEDVSRRPAPALDVIRLQIHIGTEIGDFDPIK